jgi:hypothetical protein
MDSTLLTGIIGGICTISAAVISPLALKYSETKDWVSIPRDRRNALQGKWSGDVVQYLADATIRKFTVEITLVIKGKRINGIGIIIADKLYHVTLDGSFRNDKFLKMDYQNKDPNIVQFGSFVFHLDDEPKDLVGRFVGYGHIAKAIIYGTCELKKVEP